MKIVQHKISEDEAKDSRYNGTTTTTLRRVKSGEVLNMVVWKHSEDNQMVNGKGTGDGTATRVHLQGYYHSKLS